MTFRTLFLIGITIAFAGCTKKEAAPPPARDETPAAAEAMAPDAESMTSEQVAAGTDAFIEHMHEHAKQLGRIKLALEADDLDGALTPAYWLSRHEGVHGPLYDWETYLDQMRSGAADIANATDLEAARAAEKRIEEGCAGCHSAAGAYVPDLLPRSM
ncbi:MAG: hypothetical protein KJN77_01075 [Gammaproteobacteria bacterium]|nr:hypothetical protein [Gammaproteobacteria bacterium]